MHTYTAKHNKLDAADELVKYLRRGFHE
jgi:hypothetical protein